jgi:hypothetical protein
MHQHVAHPPGPDAQSGVLENISDTLLNAFGRVRKPDERFLQMRERVDKFEEGLQVSERLWGRIRSRTNGELLLCRPGRLGASADRETAILNPGKTSLRTTTTSPSPSRAWASSRVGSRTR